MGETLNGTGLHEFVKFVARQCIQGNGEYGTRRCKSNFRATSNRRSIQERSANHGCRGRICWRILLPNIIVGGTSGGGIRARAESSEKVDGGDVKPPFL